MDDECLLLNVLNRFKDDFNDDVLIEYEVKKYNTDEKEI